MASAAIGVVGKLPAWADFVRLGARAPAFEQLLGWLIDGTEKAAADGPSEFVRLARGDVQAFCFRAGESLLAGALTPSYDQAGRCFPVAAALEVTSSPELERRPEALPIVLEAAWAHTGRLVLDLQRAESNEAGGAGWDVEILDTFETALETYCDWTRQLSLEDFLELVFGGDLRAAALTLSIVEDAIAPYAGVERPSTPLSLRVPLGAAGGAAVCFWLDLVRRLLRWRRTAPSFFWSHDGSGGVLMLHLGFVPETALAELWLPSGTRDEICDLVVARPATWRSDRLDAWASVLDQPGKALVELLDASEFGL